MQLEKKDPNFNLTNFGKLISNKSKTQVIMVKNRNELSDYLKKSLIKDELVIGMGAGIISKWMAELKLIL